MHSLLMPRVPRGTVGEKVHMSGSRRAGSRQARLVFLICISQDTTLGLPMVIIIIVTVRIMVIIIIRIVIVIGILLNTM